MSDESSDHTEQSDTKSKDNLSNDKNSDLNKGITKLQVFKEYNNGQSKKVIADRQNIMNIVSKSDDENTLSYLTANKAFSPMPNTNYDDAIQFTRTNSNEKPGQLFGGECKVDGSGSSITPVLIPVSEPNYK